MDFNGSLCKLNGHFNEFFASTSNNCEILCKLNNVNEDCRLDVGKTESDCSGYETPVSTFDLTVDVDSSHVNDADFKRRETPSQPFVPSNYNMDLSSKNRLDLSVCSVPETVSSCISDVSPIRCSVSKAVSSRVSDVSPIRCSVSETVNCCVSDVLSICCSVPETVGSIPDVSTIDDVASCISDVSSIDDVVRAGSSHDGSTMSEFESSYGMITSVSSIISERDTSREVTEISCPSEFLRDLAANPVDAFDDSVCSSASENVSRNIFDYMISPMSENTSKPKDNADDDREVTIDFKSSSRDDSKNKSYWNDKINIECILNVQVLLKRICVEEEIRKIKELGVSMKQPKVPLITRYLKKKRCPVNNRKSLKRMSDPRNHSQDVLDPLSRENSSQFKKSAASRRRHFGKYQCVNCKVTYSNESLFVKHVRKGKCFKPSTSKTDTSTLVRGKHGRFIRPSQIEFNKSKKSSPFTKVYLCDLCDKRYCDRFLLRKHIKKKHGMKRLKLPSVQYQCIFCAKTLLKKGSIRKHLSFKHKDQLASKFGTNKNGDKCLICRMETSNITSTRERGALPCHKAKSNDESASTVSHSGIATVNGRTPSSKDRINKRRKQSGSCFDDGSEGIGKRPDEQDSISKNPVSSGIYKSSRNRASIQNHAGRRIGCLFCNNLFLLISSAKRHILRMHKDLWKDPKVYAELGLNYEFTTPQDCKQNLCRLLEEKNLISVVEKPTTEDNHACRFCHKDFADFSTFQKHVRTVHKKPCESKPVPSNPASERNVATESSVPNADKNESYFFSPVRKKDPYAFRNRSDITKSIDTGSKFGIHDKYVCLFCHSAYDSSNRAQQHVRYRHKDKLTEAPATIAISKNGTITTRGLAFSAVKSDKVSKKSESPQTESDLNQSLECRQCNRTFEKRISLILHSVRMHKFSPFSTSSSSNASKSTEVPCKYTCKHCGKIFYSYSMYSRHMLQKLCLIQDADYVKLHTIGDDQAYRCPDCGKILSKLDWWIVHIKQRICHRRKKQAEINSTDLNLSSSKKSNSSTCSDQESTTELLPCRCHNCGKGFRFRYQLSLHKAEKSCKYASSVFCKTCNKSFPNDKKFYEHRRMHGSVFCEMCDARFISERGRNIHMKIVHSCKVVSSRTETGIPSDFDANNNNVDPSYLSANESSNVADVGEERVSHLSVITCHNCGGYFRSRSELMTHKNARSCFPEHLRTHASQFCNLCNVWFISEHGYKTHQGMVHRQNTVSKRSSSKYKNKNLQVDSDDPVLEGVFDNWQRSKT